MRPVLPALIIVCLGTMPGLAQDLTTQDLTTDAAGAANATLTIDPGAIIDKMPQSANVLTGLYATLATLELCGVSVPDPVDAAMSAHRQQMETSLAMDAATGAKAYETVRADVEKTGIDCAEGSAERQQADAVVALYAAETAPQ